MNLGINGAVNHYLLTINQPFMLLMNLMGEHGGNITDGLVSNNLMNYFNQLVDAAFPLPEQIHPLPTDHVNENEFRNHCVLDLYVTLINTLGDVIQNFYTELQLRRHAYHNYLINHGFVVFEEGIIPNTAFNVGMIHDLHDSDSDLDRAYKDDSSDYELGFDTIDGDEAGDF